MTNAQLKAALTEQGIEFKSSAKKDELEALLLAAAEAAEETTKKAVKRIKHQSSKEEGSLRDQGGSVVVVVEGDVTRIIEGVQGHGVEFTKNIAEALDTDVESLLGSDATLYTLTAANAYKSRPEDRA